jgi:catechol 2,3-dioxygenase-like lactoylglutathione lyase family enzyme
MPTSFTRLVVSVADLERALDFYHRLLGLPVRRSPGFAILEADAGVEVFLHERPVRTSDLSVAACFRVDDVDERVAAWSDRAGVVVDHPADQPWGERMAVVRDPDGHLVCLIGAPRVGEAR